jgi:hypothetical protein
VTKAYVIKIKAPDEDSAKNFCEFFTGDIKDISTESDRKHYNFKIEEIDCKINDALILN